MFTITSILGLLVLLGLVVFFHEAGHFVAAKWARMRVDEFAMGFGPSLFKYTRGETEYKLNIIPLGGYVKIAGMEPGEEDVENGFYTKRKRMRLMALVAGPAMNFVLAIFLFWIYGATYGIPTEAIPVVDKVFQGKAAHQAGIQPGDELLSIDGRKVADTDDAIRIIGGSPGKAIVMTVQRGAEKLELRVIPDPELEQTIDDTDPDHIKVIEEKRGKIGIVFQTKVEKVGALKAIAFGFEQTFMITMALITYLIGMVMGKLPVAFGGPIMIANQLGQDLQVGLAPYLFDLALISINIGLVNLLPIPPLDGSRLLFTLVEAVRGKPLPREKEAMVHLVGFVLLMLLMVWIVVQDVLVLVRGASLN